MAEFTQDIQRWILKTEGGYVDHPRDPGGATNLGITHRTLANWRGVPSVTKADVRNLTVDEAMAIYKDQYWDTVRGDRLPRGLDYAVFDYAVNSGPSKAAKDLQRVLGVSVDGIVGAETLAAAHAASAVQTIEDLSERRYAFVKGLSTFGTFGRGWTRRIWGDEMGVQPGTDTGVADRATKLALGTAPETIPEPQEVPGKAEPEEPSAVDSLVKDSGGISGLAGGAAAIFGAITDQPILQIAVIVFIGVLLWRFVLVKQKASDA